MPVQLATEMALNSKVWWVGVHHTFRKPQLQLQLGVWDPSILGYLEFGNMGFWDLWNLGSWEFGILGIWDHGNLGS